MLTKESFITAFEDDLVCLKETYGSENHIDINEIIDIVFEIINDEEISDTLMAFNKHLTIYDVYGLVERAMINGYHVANTRLVYHDADDIRNILRGYIINSNI